jgi:hypothetical protein
MTQKIRIQLNLDKISKDKLNKFDRKDGTKGVSGEFDVVPVKEETIMFENEKFAKVKTHFIAEPSKKGEESIYVGEGYVYRNKGDGPAPVEGLKEEDFDF